MQDNSSNSNPNPSNSRLNKRSSAASFTSPSILRTASPHPPPQNLSRRSGFNIERVYEFEAPQFYDFTKQSDPERGHLDEHWFGNN